LEVILLKRVIYFGTSRGPEAHLTVSSEVRREQSPILVAVLPQSIGVQNMRFISCCYDHLPVFVVCNLPSLLVIVLSNVVEPLLTIINEKRDQDDSIHEVYDSHRYSQIVLHYPEGRVILGNLDKIVEIVVVEQGFEDVLVKHS
jgi:hypothetical protein